MPDILAINVRDAVLPHDGEAVCRWWLAFRFTHHHPIPEV